MPWEEIRYQRNLNNLTDLFSMPPFSIPWKHQKTLRVFFMFSSGRERVH